MTGTDAVVQERCAKCGYDIFQRGDGEWDLVHVEWKPTRVCIHGDAFDTSGHLPVGSLQGRRVARTVGAQRFVGVIVGSSSRPKQPASVDVRTEQAVRGPTGRSYDFVHIVDVITLRFLESPTPAAEEEPDGR